MKSIFLGLAFIAPQVAFGDADVNTGAQANECVILLHGVMRSSTSMLLIERDLKAENYQVINMDYPSTDTTVEKLAETYIPIAMSQCTKGEKINFVTHSMGGILVRSYFKAHQDQKPNRVVMLAPPNQGSEVIDDEAFKILGGVSGQSGAQLGTGPDSLPNTLGPVDYEVGVIAGDASINPIFSDIIPGPDDGAVAVARTHLEGETDWVTVKATHSFIMNNPTARRQMLEFLKNGKFAR